MKKFMMLLILSLGFVNFAAAMPGPEIPKPSPSMEEAVKTSINTQ